MPKVIYGPWLEMDWSDEELAKIRELKDRPDREEMARFPLKAVYENPATGRDSPEARLVREIWQ